MRSNRRIATENNNKNNVEKVSNGNKQQGGPRVRLKESVQVEKTVGNKGSRFEVMKKVMIVDEEKGDKEEDQAMGESLQVATNEDRVSTTGRVDNLGDNLVNLEVDNPTREGDKISETISPIVGNALLGNFLENENIGIPLVKILVHHNDRI